MATALVLLPLGAFALPVAGLDTADIALGAAERIAAPAVGAVPGLAFAVGGVGGRDDDIDLRFHAVGRATPAPASSEAAWADDFRTGPLDAVEPALEATFEALAEPAPQDERSDAAIASALVHEIAARRRVLFARRGAFQALSAVPEPAPLPAMAAGLVVLALVGRASRRR